MSNFKYTNGNKFNTGISPLFQLPLDDRSVIGDIDALYIDSSNPTASPLYGKAYTGMIIAVKTSEDDAYAVILNDDAPYTPGTVSDISEGNYEDYWTEVGTGNGVIQVAKYSDLALLKMKDDEIGSLAYVQDEDMHYVYRPNKTWQKFYISNIETSDTAPENTAALWLDTSEEADWNDANTLDSMKSDIKSLQTAVIKLQNIQTYGVLAGDATTSGLEEIYDGTDPIEPVDSSIHYDSSTSPVEPTKVDGQYVTVSHIRIKVDTAANFNANKANLIDGEIVYFTNNNKIAVYYNGSLHATGSSTDATGGGLSLEELQALSLDYLMFVDSESNKYRVKVIDGIATAVPYDTNTTAVGSPDDTWGVYVNYLLSINSVYCGGGHNSDDCLCSHNYVELANGSDTDVNLNGLYLLYTDGTKANSSDVGYSWDVLALSGVVKAGSTFVIRGAQCNTMKASMIKVEGYDMIWEVNNNPISFSQSASSFYLCAGTSFQSLLDTNSLNNPWLKTKTQVGYVDAVGFGTNAVSEGSSNVTPKNVSSWDGILFVRWFMLDPSKQANKAYASRKSSTLWTYINLNKQTTRLGNSIQYYFPDDAKIKFAPKPSSADKDFFSNKTKFDATRPNMINITFGIQATDGGTAATRATRCFNWVSVGNYDEFIQYKKTSATSWTTVESILDGQYSDFRNEHYKRLRWCTSYGEWVTSHKVIISSLEAGDYEYRVGRYNDESYISETLTFTVKLSSAVTSFSYIQTTDQQGFNWIEYQAWKRAAYYISQNESGYDFTINTGDITQSGNRVNEWMDYYDGRQYLRGKEEMFTIGNNDLCGHNSTELTDGNDATSKYNHINVLRYFTFELDSSNTNYTFTWGDETRQIYSLYSFNYGAFHFICLNSEIAQASSKTYKDWSSNTYTGDASYAQAANAKIEDWLLKDLQTWTGKTDPSGSCSKAIVYMHEMPFTMTTYTVLAGTGARAGSHLNTLNSNGNYRFSRLFKKYGIRLVMGGHKHTYTISKPIYDAPTDYITSSHIANNSVSLLDGEVTNALSRTPVIQVTKDSDIVSGDSFARYEKVSTINAPTYVMSQATGYKLVSNKEQPSDSTYLISWLMSYFKQPDGTGTGTTENVKQHYPMYVRYDLTASKIDVTASQIHNIWDVNVDSNKSSYDINNQLSDLSATKMTLSEISASDKTAYGISDTTKYTINL